MTACPEPLPVFSQFAALLTWVVKKTTESFILHVDDFF